MISRVIVTHEPIVSVLRLLGPPWWPSPGEVEEVSQPRTEDRSDAGEEAAEESARVRVTSGAWLDFYGVVRDREDSAEDPAGFAIEAIDYEAREEMAVYQMEKILKELSSVYPLQAVLVIHRIGLVRAGEASLLVRILSGHREEAVRCCAEFLDQLKKWVPIWKHPVKRGGGERGRAT